MTEAANGTASELQEVDGKEGEVSRRRLSVRKKLLFLVILLLGAALATEAAARVVLFIKHDFNPFYLTFGFVPNIESLSAADRQAGYTKFEPSTMKHQKYKGRTIPIKINADGFRGISEFTRPKPENAYRIVALGGSSTFGFYVEDDETFPFQLEKFLRENLPDGQIEVFNLGIPHARTDDILALARSELPDLAPDLIVLYSGCNDANHPPTRVPHSYRAKDWLYFHSVAWRCVHPAIKRAYYALARATNADPVGLPSLALPITVPGERVEELRANISEHYCSNVRALADFARQIDSHLLLVTQSYTLHYSKGSGLEGDWQSYSQEVEFIERQYAEMGSLRAHQIPLLAHRDLMKALRQIAGEKDLPLAEGIAALDGDRSQMLSYVHLSPTGNRLIAEAILAAIIRAHLLPGHATGS